MLGPLHSIEFAGVHKKVVFSVKAVCRCKSIKRSVYKNI